MFEVCCNAYHPSRRVGKRGRSIGPWRGSCNLVIEYTMFGKNASDTDLGIKGRSIETRLEKRVKCSWLKETSWDCSRLLQRYAPLPPVLAIPSQGVFEQDPVALLHVYLPGMGQNACQRTATSTLTRQKILTVLSVVSLRKSSMSTVSMGFSSNSDSCSTAFSKSLFIGSVSV